jgi:cysteine desulfurase/selenocysteine lyase
VSLGAAIDYLSRVDATALARHEADLLSYATARLAEIEGARMIGTARDKSGVVSFVLDGIHAHDVGTIVDQQGVAVRTGHHCAMPVMERFGVPATARASLAFYNTREELDALGRALGTVREVFG